MIGGAQSLCFAVPSDTLRWVAGEILRRGAVRRAWLGIAAQTVPLPRRTALHHGIAARTVVGVDEVTRGGPADRAGLKRGDILQALDGEVLGDVADFYRKLWSTGPAGTVVMLRMERDNDAFEVTVRTGDRARYHKFGSD